jgi:hypothetical protein
VLTAAVLGVLKFSGQESIFSVLILRGRGGSVASMFGSMRLDFGVRKVVFFVRRHARPRGFSRPRKMDFLKLK